MPHVGVVAVSIPSLGSHTNGDELIKFALRHVA